MSETKRVASPMANTMTVLDQGEEILRSTSSLTRRPLKKATSEGLISLSAEPGNVRFEVSNHKLLESEGTRCSSAGRIERKLQLFKKKEDTEEQRRNSTEGIFFKPQPVNPLITKINAMTIGTTATVAKTKSLQDEKPTSRAKSESESSESESELDESELNDEETEQNATSNGEKAMEAKAEFLQCVMSGNYTKAQEICKQILLLEPDNATCMEFHSVIATKIEQDNMEDSDDDDDSEDEDNDEDDDDEEEDDDNENEDDSNTSSSSEESEEDTDEEEFTITPGLNLLMGGLPIKPQAK